MFGAILEFIRNLKAYELVYDLIIIAVAVGIFVRLNNVSKKLKTIKTDSDKAFRNTQRETRLNSNGNLSQASVTELDSDKYEPVRKRFNEENVKFISAVNLISVLPLMGLFGTVVGLIPGLQAVKSQDFEVLYSSLSTALSSTVVGLLSSIILKFYVSMGPEKNINSIDIIFNEIDRRYSNAIGLNKIDN